ncbi:MAG: hypothetical protein A3J79_12290 [Elusimicrobia bacterium RIFOXYB2_FULL_62_6]|nr:MAG: hypothetical protein A3J79_12290 [Elusimicrobia bacterium RIFOXYB2_FULL_62_6]
MKKLVIAIIALLVIGAIGTTVFAGEMKKEGSVMLGYAMPGGDVGDIIDGGIAFGFGFEGYKINDMFSLGAEIIYTSGSGDYDPLGLGAGYTYDYEVSTLGLLPYAKYSKEIDMGGNKADIYGLFGMGLYSCSIDIAGASGSESEFGFNLGGGMMFPLNDKMKIGGDVRYHLVASDLSYFVPSAKFVMSF